MKKEKTIYIRRFPISNSEKSANAETQEYFNQGNRSIGSFFRPDSVRPGTGLTLPEENLLMPHIIDLDPQDRSFKSKVAEYFHAIDLKIPSHDKVKDIGGLRLNISLQNDDLELGAYLDPENKRLGINLPLNPSDYIKWKFCLAHPDVAKSEKEGTGNQLKMFYIYDGETVSKEKISDSNMKDKAITEYIKIKENPEKVLQLLLVLNIPRDEYLGKENDTLRSIAELDAPRFLKAASNKNLEFIALLREMLEAKIIERAGERFLYTETKAIFAVNDLDALGYLKDPKNSNDLLAFKEKVKEYRKLHK